MRRGRKRKRDGYKNSERTHQGDERRDSQRDSHNVFNFGFNRERPPESEDLHPPRKKRKLGNALYSQRDSRSHGRVNRPPNRRPYYQALPRQTNRGYYPQSSSFTRRPQVGLQVFKSDCRDLARQCHNKNRSIRDAVKDLIESARKNLIEPRRWESLDENVIQYCFMEISKDRDLSRTLAAFHVALAERFPARARSSRYISTVVHRLGKLARDIKNSGQRDANIAVDLAQQLLQCRPNANSQAIANSLWGLGKLAEAGLLPQANVGVAIDLAQQLLQCRQDVNPQDIANTLWGLGKLAEVGLLPRIEVRVVIDLAKQLQCRQDAKPQAIANSLWGLGRLAEAGLLPRIEVRVVIDLAKQLQCRQDAKPQEIANSLWGLGRLAEAGLLPRADVGVVIDLAKQLLQRREDVNPQAVANTLWGLGVLVQTNQLQLPNSLIGSIQKCSQIFLKKEMRHVQQYVQGLFMLKLPLPQPLTERLEQHRPQSSFPHQRISQSLGKAGITHQNEALVGAYYVDILLSEGKIIIEIDGQHHAKAQQFNKDALRDKLLKESGYRILRFSNQTSHQQIIREVQSMLKTKPSTVLMDKRPSESLKRLAPKRRSESDKPVRQFNPGMFPLFNRTVSVPPSGDAPPYPSLNSTL